MSVTIGLSIVRQTAFRCFPDTDLCVLSARFSEYDTTPAADTHSAGVVIRVNIEFRVGAEREWGWIPGLCRRRMSSRSGRPGWRLVVGSPICANAGDAAGYCAHSHPPFRSSTGRIPRITVPIAASSKPARFCFKVSRQGETSPRLPLMHRLSQESRFTWTAPSPSTRIPFARRRRTTTRHPVACTTKSHLRRQDSEIPKVGRITCAALWEPASPTSPPRHRNLPRRCPLTPNASTPLTETYKVTFNAQLVPTIESKLHSLNSI